MYANTTTGKRENVSKSADVRVLQKLRVDTTNAVLIQSTTTTTTTYTGLNYNDANTLCVASESSVLNSTSRSYLGTAKITLSVGQVSMWNTIEACWGTRVTSQMQRMGDSNLYQVSISTQVMTVSNSGGTLELQ